MMKRSNLLCGGLIALLAIPASAAEPVTPPRGDSQATTAAKTTTDLPAPAVPRRQLEFDVSEAEHGLALSTVDPKLLEQRYVATLHFSPASDRVLSDLAKWLHGKGALSVSVPEGADRQTAIPAERFFVSDLPQGRFPSEEISSAFTAFASGANRQTVLLRTIRVDGTPPSDRLFQVEILAPTAERARELATGFVAFCDYGVSYAWQRAYLRVKRDLEQRLPELHTALEQTQQEVASLESQVQELKEYADVSEDALNSLVAQQRLISVDLAGVEARIEACNKMLSDRRHGPKHTEQVETLKIAAEIELVGLAARRDCIAKIVEKVFLRRDLAQKVTHARNAAAELEKIEIQRTEKEIIRTAARLKECLPVQVQANNVTIRRIRWEPEKQK